MPNHKIEVHKTHFSFAPRWWQLRKRYRIWKSRRYKAKMMKMLRPEEQQLYEEIQKDIERRILFGDE